MKRSIFTIFVLFSIFACYGKNMEKQYRKLIEKYDIDQAVKEIDRANASTFWDIMLKNNELLIKFIEDIEKNKGAEKETSGIFFLIFWLSTQPFYKLGRYSNTSVIF